LLAIGVVLASFGAFFKPLSGELGWARGDTSGAFSVAMLVSGAMSIAAGRMADKFSPRLVITGSGILIGCSCLLMSRMTALWQLYFYYGILIGSGLACIVPATSLIVRTYKERRGLLTGIAQAGGSFGAILAAPFATMLIENYDWRSAFIILGILVLAINGVSALFLRDPARENPDVLDQNLGKQKGISGQSGSLLITAFKSLPFWLLGIILFCNGFAQNVINVHIIPHATDSGISPIAASAIMAVFQGACGLGSFISGRMNDIIGGKMSLLICSLVLAFSQMLLITANTVWVFYLVAVLSGIGIGGAVLLRSTITAELFGLHSHGEISGAIMCISSIGCSVGPLLAGYVFDVSGEYRWAFIITLGICIAGMATAWILKSRSPTTKISKF
jgi:MFS family permease